MRGKITGWFYLSIWLLGTCFFSLLNLVIHGFLKQNQKDLEKSKERNKRKRSVWYGVIGGSGGFVAILCGHYAGTSKEEGILTFLFLGVLTVTAAVDQETMEIPDSLPITVLILSAISVLLEPEGLLQMPLASRIIGFFSASVPMLLLALAIPGAFGGGDIKLMAACGAFLGWKRNLLALFFAVLGGGVWGIWLLLKKKATRTDAFAFGPFLCTGMAISLFWGERLLLWYLKELWSVAF